MDEKVIVYIEIEKDSNIKCEYDEEKRKLVVDRILPYPYYYPYSYGFIINTLAMDGDDLDALIITDKKIELDKHYSVFIIGVLLMEDEKGMDEKILCVLEEDYSKINDISDLDNDVKDNISWFFSNYKNKTQGRWAKVYGYRSKEYAINLYKKSCVV